jgi:hypothetical protein
VQRCQRKRRLRPADELHWGRGAGSLGERDPRPAGVALPHEGNVSAAGYDGNKRQQFTRVRWFGYHAHWSPLFWIFEKCILKVLKNICTYREWYILQVYKVPIQNTLYWTLHIKRQNYRSKCVNSMPQILSDFFFFVWLIIRCISNSILICL